jgi:Capsule polysaccharide biosynthesis protein
MARALPELAETMKFSVKSTAKRLLKSLRLYSNTASHSTASTSDPDWARILDREGTRWKSACAAARNGPRILIANAYGMGGVSSIESTLAAALTLRGAQVHFLVCDAALPACWASHIDYQEPEEFARVGPVERLCGKCFAGASASFDPLGLPIHRYSEFLTADEVRKAGDLSSTIPVHEIAEYHLDGLSVGEQVVATALRFYGRGNLNGESHAEAILRRYLNAALLTLFASRRLMNTFSFLCVSSLHGLYVPEGLIGEVAREQKVRVVNWSYAYRKRTFIFSHHDTYHHTLLSESPMMWEKMSWTPQMEASIVDYLGSRRYGTHDWITYVREPEEDLTAIAAKIGVDFSKPCIGLLTNVMWDAQVNYCGNAFDNMLEWVLETIRYFASRNELQLIIRVHPAEVQGEPGAKSHQSVVDEIRRRFPTLPPNVFVIPPESSISTYAVMSKCNAVAIYSTKTGVELTCMGIPVIVAGEAWIRNKGLTLDANSSDEYFKILDRLPLKDRLSETVTQQARKYAYHFFFRHLIPLPFVVPMSPYKIELSGIDDLLPGRSVGLDVICNGILNGAEFIYPAEHYPETIVN